LEARLVSSKATAIAVDTSTVASVVGICTFAPEASVSATATSAAREAAHARTTLNTAELVPVRACLLALGADTFDVAQKLGKLLGSVSHVDALILAILVDEVELPEHLQEGDVGARIVDNSFGAVLDEELEKLESLEPSAPHLEESMVPTLYICLHSSAAFSVNRL
jgi:hypothetical protein